MRTIFDRKALLLATVATACLVPIAAQAQDTANSGQIQDIVVTARRVGESAQKTPVAITAISPAQLEQKALTMATELSKATPSLTIVGSSTSPAGLYISMRGQVASDTAAATGSSVGIYLDDTFEGAAPIAGNLLDFSDVERVEILKGPQGTLYGRNVTGGLVKFVTNKPTDKLEAYLKGGLGNYDRHYVNGMVNIPLAGDKLAMRVVGTFDEHSGYSYDVVNKRDLDDNHRWMIRGELLAKPADNLEILLQGYYGKAHDGGADNRMIYAAPGANLATVNYAIAKGINGNTNADLIPILAYGSKVGAGTASAGELGAFLSAYGKFLGALPATLTDIAAEANAPRNQAMQDPNFLQYDRTDLRGATGTVSLDLGNVTLRSITAYSYGHNQRAYNVGGSSVPPVFGEQGAAYRQFSQEFQVNGKAMDGKLKYAVGFYYYRATVRDDRNPSNRSGASPYGLGQFGLGAPGGIAALAAAYPFLTPADLADASAAIAYPALALNTSLVTSNATYGQFTYAITDTVHFTGGLRYTDESDSVQGYAANLNYDGTYRSCASPAEGLPTNPADLTDPTKCGTAKASTNNTNWSYTAGLDWQITPSAMVYAKTSRGFKAGGVNVFAGPGAPMAPFLPEQNTDYEVGVKADFLDHRARVNLDYFHTNYTNIQRAIAQNIPGTVRQFTATRNAGKAKIDGVELEATLKPFGGLTLGGTMAYTDARYVTYTTLYPNPADGVKDLSSLPFQGLAKWTYTLSAGYDLPFGENNIHAQVDWSHRSSAVLFENDILPNTPVAPNGINAAPVSVLTQPGYGLLDLSLSADIPSLHSTVTVWGKNVLNKKYYVCMISLVKDGVGSTWANYGAPATFGVDWKVKF